MDDPASLPPDGPPSDRARREGTPPPHRSSLRLVLAVGIVLTGLVWIGQGLGILTAGGSFMIGDPLWAIIGAAFVVGGALLGTRELRRG